MNWIGAATGLLLAALPATLAAAELKGEEMRSTLTGNSIVNPDFGCVFYQADGTTRIVGQAGGEVAIGNWAVKGDLYYSSGQCGLAGCSLSGDYPDFTFRRTDGGYEQPVILIRGNHCEKDGIIS